METETWTKPKRFPAQQQQKQQLKIVVQEKRRKREGKYRLVFLFFFSLFVFVLFGLDERELGVNRLEGKLCWNFTVVFALWLPQGTGERGGGLCVRIASTFGANFRLMKSARHDAARQKPWGQLC